jgi:hypothetical protein
VEAVQEALEFGQVLRRIDPAGRIHDTPSQLRRAEQPGGAERVRQLVVRVVDVVA